MATTIRPAVGQGERSLLSLIPAHRRYSPHYPKFQYAVSVLHLSLHLWDFTQHAEVTGADKLRACGRHGARTRPTRRSSEYVAQHVRRAAAPCRGASDNVPRVKAARRRCHRYGHDPRPPPSDLHNRSACGRTPSPTCAAELRIRMPGGCRRVLGTAERDGEICKPDDEQEYRTTSIGGAFHNSLVAKSRRG